jgi:hypothetical protein
MHAKKKIRPDGSTPLGLSWLCLVLSIVMFALSSGTSPEPWEAGQYASPTTIASAADRVATITMMQSAAAALFALFLVLWSVGSIVSAISFLPGEPE